MSPPKGGAFLAKRCVIEAPALGRFQLSYSAFPRSLPASPHSPFLPGASPGTSALFRTENFSPIRRQCVENTLAIAPGDQALVEDGDGAAVLLRADQASAGLYQAGRGLGHADFQEGIAALGLYPPGEGGFHRVVGHGEGNLGNDDVRAVGARQVDALGEAGEAEQNAALAAVDALAVARQELLLGEVVLARYQGEQAGIDAGEHVLHLAAGAEQYQCPGAAVDDIGQNARD